MELCIACGHPISRHFQDVTGVVRCIHTNRGTTTHGIIGMPYEIHCDCANYKSEAAEIRKRKRAEDEAEEQKRFDEALASLKGVRKISSVDELFSPAGQKGDGR
jgi:hypothetical protein